MTGDVSRVSPHHARTALHDLLDDAAELVEVDATAAMSILAMVLTPRLRREDPGASGRAAYLRARILCERGSYQEALGAIRSAHLDFLAAGQTLAAIRTDIGKACVFHEIGDYSSAIALCEQLLSTLGQLEPAAHDAQAVSDARARTHTNLARSLARTGDHTQALHQYDLAWERFRALGDTAMQAQVERDRGTAYLRAGMTRRALDDLERAWSTLADLGLTLHAARCAMPMADCLLTLRRHVDAIRMLEEVRPHFEARQARPELARLGLTLSNALLQAGLSYDARVEAQAAADILLDLDMVGESARALLISGIASASAHDLDQAAIDLEVAERLYRHTQDHDHRAMARLSQAWLAHHRGDTDEAVRLALGVLQGDGSARHPGVTALADLVLVVVRPAHEDAPVHLGRARRQIEASGLWSLRLVRDVAQAKHLHRTDQLADAAAVLRETLLADLDDAPTGHAPVLGTPLSDTVVVGEAYTELIDVLVRIGSHVAVTEAWQWANIARARNIDDFASAVVGDHRSALSPEPGADGDLREQELARLSDALDQLVADDELHDPQHFEATQLAVRRVLRRRIIPATLGPGAQIRALAPPIPEGPVLQYHMIGDDIIAFVVREGQVYARRLAQAATETASRLSEWRVECSRMTHLGPPIADDGAIPFPLVALHKILIDPIEDLIDDLAGCRLLVVGHRHLHGVPFEALTGGRMPLSSRFDLSFAAGLANPGDVVGSWSDAHVERTRPASVLVLAAPDERAPLIVDEAAALQDLYGDATVLVNDDATSHVLAAAGGRHDLLHIACHGRYCREHPPHSGLRLADRWVTASEILQLDLTDAVVVLNACASGEGTETLTEAGGLVWSFLAAGCRGVVATTWPVDDAVASEFAVCFHRRIVEGASPADAVRLATRELAERWPHPWSWAAFRYISADDRALFDL